MLEKNQMSTYASSNKAMHIVERCHFQHFDTVDCQLAPTLKHYNIMETCCISDITCLIFVWCNMSF